MTRRVRTKAQIREDTERQEKVCPKCRELKPFSEYPPSKRRHDGVHPSCRACRKAYAAAYVASGVRRNKYLRWKYSISLEDYDAMLVSQGGGCAICGLTAEEESHYSVLPVDHCHTTGAIRGILCQKCNSGLGFFRDNKELLQQAIVYLSKR